MADTEIADLLMWLEPQHLPFLNLFQIQKETLHAATEADEQADTEDHTEAAPAA